MFTRNKNLELIATVVVKIIGHSLPLVNKNMAHVITLFALSNLGSLLGLWCYPFLLEPFVRMSIRVPSDHVGDVMSDLNTRRGHVHGVEPDGDYSVVQAEAPLAEVQRYATELRSLAQGRGSFTIEPDRYMEVPTHVQDQVLNELQEFEAAET